MPILELERALVVTRHCRYLRNQCDEKGIRANVDDADFLGACCLVEGGLPAPEGSSGSGSAAVAHPGPGAEAEATAAVAAAAALGGGGGGGVPTRLASHPYLILPETLPDWATDGTTAHSGRWSGKGKEGKGK